MVNQGSLFILFSKSNRPSTYCELLLSHDWERLLPEGKEKKVVWTSTKQISPHLVEMNSEGAFWRNNFWTMYILLDYNYLRKTQGQLDILTLFQNSFQQVVLAESSNVQSLEETYLLDGAYIKYFFSQIWTMAWQCLEAFHKLCLPQNLIMFTYILWCLLQQPQSHMTWHECMALIATRVIPVYERPF